MTQKTIFIIVSIELVALLLNRQLKIKRVGRFQSKAVQRSYKHAGARSCLRHVVRARSHIVASPSFNPSRKNMQKICGKNNHLPENQLEIGANYTFIMNWFWIFQQKLCRYFSFGEHSIHIQIKMCNGRERFRLYINAETKWWSKTLNRGEVAVNECCFVHEYDTNMDYSVRERNS